VPGSARSAHGSGASSAPTSRPGRPTTSVELAGKLGPGKVALYFDCGTEDDFALQDNVQYVHEALAARHIEHELFLGPGKHDFGFWSARVPKSLAFLRDHTARPE
jgi:S-formylglutathione hydrolase FrmB